MGATREGCTHLGQFGALRDLILELQGYRLFIRSASEP